MQEQKNFIKNYDNIAKKFSNSRKNMKWEEIDYFLEKYFTENKKVSVLDVGCGSARLLEHISEKFEIEYLGVDLSPEMIMQAKKNFPKQNFEVLDMQELQKLEPQKFDFVFFIASFHHKKFLRERIETLEKLKNLLGENSIAFMTNWALDSEINKEKYSSSEIIFTKEDFENIEDFEEKQKEKNFKSKDFSIKFGEFFRYYHCFTLEELEFLFKKNNFQIIENRLFDNKRNFISIFKK